VILRHSVAHSHYVAPPQELGARRCSNFIEPRLDLRKRGKII
jgi:hypothetical protein